eukprot:9499752-Pyramimonas_sp.AAC.1
MLTRSIDSLSAEVMRARAPIAVRNAISGATDWRAPASLAIAHNNARRQNPREVLVTLGSAWRSAAPPSST